MRIFVGLLMFVLGFALSRYWWTRRHARKEAGILPLSAAGMMVDEQAKPASIARVVKAFAHAWSIMAGVALIAAGADLLFGEIQ